MLTQNYRLGQYSVLQYTTVFLCGQYFNNWESGRSFEKKGQTMTYTSQWPIKRHHHAYIIANKAQHKHTNNTQQTCNKSTQVSQDHTAVTGCCQYKLTQHITVSIYTNSLLSPSASVLSLKPAGGSRHLHPSEI